MTAAADMTDAVVAAVLNADPDQRVTMLTRLAFAAAERPRGPSARRLRALLADHLERVADSAVIVARQSGAPMTDLLARAIARRGDVALARRIIHALGEGRGHLNVLDLACGRVIMADVLATGVLHDPVGAVHDTARLVERLNEAGRPKAGIAVLRRVLGAFRRAGLATPLGLMSQLGSLMATAGEYRRAEILLLRALESADKAGVPAWDMVDDWINLATVRSNLRDYQGALDAGRRAIALLDGAQDADQPRRDDRDALLAVALSNHALFLQEAGDLEAAHEAVSRALSLNERLTARDHDAYAPRLVEALINASYISALRGDMTAARARSGQAVAEAARLPAATLAAHGGAMVSGMINHAIDLERQGEAEHAMEMATEAAALAGRLLKDFGRHFLPSAVDAEAAVCNIGLQGSYLHQARAAGERAMMLSAELPDDAMGLRALTILPNLSDVYAKGGAHRAAIEAATQAYRLLREAEEGDGADAIDREVRIGVRNVYAQRLSEQGQTEDAVAIVRDAVGVAAEPENGVVSASPAYSLVHLANMLADLGDGAGAVTAAAAAVTTLERLSAHDPDWADEELPTALYTHANVLWQKGDAVETRRVLDRAVALNRRRIERDFRSAVADLAAVLEFSAVVANRMGEIDRATAEIDQALSFYEHLAVESGTGFQFDLANGLHNAAMIAMTGNDLNRAIDMQQKAAGLLDGLAQKDVNAQRLMADSLVNLGLYHAMAGRVDEGMAAVDRVPDTIGGLAAEWLPARQALVGATVARSRLLVIAERYAEAAQCAGAALADITAETGDFWRGPALVNRAMALAALGTADANAAAADALAFHRRGLEAGNADDLHGYCDAAAVVIDLAAGAGTLTDAHVHELLAPLPEWFARMGSDRGGVAAAELVRAVDEHCGGIGAWPEFHRPG